MSENEKKWDEDGVQPNKAAETSAKLKNVLLIGDSIREGYCGYVKGALNGYADVRFPGENCRFTQYTYVALGNWTALFPEPEKIDLVYWNNGHWDIAHWGGAEESLNSVEVYTDMLVRIYERIRKLCPNAKVVFATTAPMNPSGVVGMNPRTNAEIQEYNRAAIARLSALKLSIDDHYEFFRAYGAEYFADYCHMTANGFEILGNHVADTIKAVLK